MRVQWAAPTGVVVIPRLFYPKRKTVGMKCSSKLDFEELVQVVSLAAGVVASGSKPRRRGGSAPGKALNRDFGVHEANERPEMDNFCREDVGDGPLFSDKEFELCYRMPRSLYENMRRDLMAYNPIFYTSSGRNRQNGCIYRLEDIRSSSQSNRRPNSEVPRATDENVGDTEQEVHTAVCLRHS